MLRGMAHAPKLKVYRMAVGFHDAYVAAPSQKAAAAAWGSGTDVFARGEAELVTDPALTAEPLARPGAIVKRLRATAAEQIAALRQTPGPAAGARKTAAPADPPPRSPKSGSARPAPAKPPPPKAARPSRAALDAAEAALAQAEARHAEALRAIETRQAALDRERAALTAKREARSGAEAAAGAAGEGRGGLAGGIRRW
jgi:hypothetical protein